MSVLSASSVIHFKLEDLKTDFLPQLTVAGSYRSAADFESIRNPLRAPVERWVFSFVEFWCIIIVIKYIEEQTFEDYMEEVYSGFIFY